MMAKIIDKLVKAIRDSALCNLDVQSKPQCILWTDRDKQWHSIIPKMKKLLPELFVLGDYNPEEHIGPAIWLRCVIAGRLPESVLPPYTIPIIYLPGASRQDLRVVEDCPEDLKAIVELQYRGHIWSQANSKDWTVLAFLNSKQSGLGLEVAQNSETKNAMLLSLNQLIEEEIDLLDGKHLDHTFFNNLLSGGDPVRELLLWLNQADGVNNQIDSAKWHGFVNVCSSTFKFHPENEGLLIGAERLAKHEGAWLPVWQRFCEAPTRYQNIPKHIRKCRPPRDKIFWMMPDGDFKGWPQWNEEQEESLRNELTNLKSMTTNQARVHILDLEKKHGRRRTLVWAEIGEAPLAIGLQHLATLAEATKSSMAAGQCSDLANAYQSLGWYADDAVVQLFSTIEKQEDYELLASVVRTIYLPWAEESAQHLQKIVEKEGYPGGSRATTKTKNGTSNECVFFVDGLRFDAAKRLSEKLANICNVQELPVWSALPSVTPTGKPAVSPVRDKIIGLEANVNFEPVVADDGQAANNYNFKKLLTSNGWNFIGSSIHEVGHGNAWCEFGDIDHEGHERGWKLCKHLDKLLEEIKGKIVQLLNTGKWKTLRIVTDHGWLLMPGGLPKVDIPKALTETKWGRCAAIKQGALLKDRLYPWFWNSEQTFALADGIGCYRSGEEYAHGGLSLQECLNLELVVSLKETQSDVIGFGTTWRGLRCIVELEIPRAGLRADLRIEAGNINSSIATSAKLFKENGTATLIVENEDLQGTQAFIVLVDQDKKIVAQKSERIGGED